MSLCCVCTTAFYYIAGISLIYFLFKYLYAKWNASKLEETLALWGKDKTPKDVVILHQFPRGTTVPSMSPMVMKVETYLRMCDIKYEVDSKSRQSPKGKFPWISLNGEHIADSEFIIEFLSKKFEKNFSKNVDKKTLAIATVCRTLLDEHFYWGLIMERYVYKGLDNVHKYMRFPYPKLFFILKMVMKRMMTSRAQAQGIGLHSEQEIIKLMEKDLRAISTILGNQKFICGDEPTEEDCGIFGELAQIIWTFPNSSYDRLIKSELKNLEAYCYRMKDKFWPDWDQVISD